jgi:hypothetical protein
VLNIKSIRAKCFLKINVYSFNGISGKHSFYGNTNDNIKARPPGQFSATVTCKYCIYFEPLFEVSASSAEGKQDEYEDCGLMGCDAVQSCRWLPEFRRNV